ncbi:MAG TPA: cytochrome c3 family protein, partial [Candidatus Limnocylindrales bacterium]|nr:cytochrome c3 family protein [Candidatus Limnocylindrales bacterium]
ALADGGPHVMTQNNGSLGINADGCAGCHRAHTATGPYLINAADETALCKTCHGAAVTGSTVDVMTGVQYALADRVGGTQLGALRGGGFDQARIDSDNATRVAYLRSATDVSFRTKVPVTTATDVTSAHIAMTENGLANPGVAWGNGANGSGVGPTVELSCASCHNPHGNGQYRILNPIPEATGTGFDDAWTVDIRVSTAADNRVHTVSSNALVVGDVVTIAGHSSAEVNGTWTVASSVNGSGGIYVTLTGLDVLTDGTGGTMTRTSGAKVSDAPLAGVGDTRNYTVLQVLGTEGNNATYLLYANQLATAAGAGTFNGIAGDYTATGGDYLHRTVPWNPDINGVCDPTVFPLQAGCTNANDAPNGKPSTFSTQITAWCSACHTRYFADRNPTTDPPNGTTGSAWQYPRPGDDIYSFQHRTVPNRACVTCHVSHGSNAVMSGQFSSAYTYPDGSVDSSSRLLKIDNRGTCQACHDPTETTVAGSTVNPAAGTTVP